jgi:hypothetical protein
VPVAVPVDVLPVDVPVAVPVDVAPAFSAMSVVVNVTTNVVYLANNTQGAVFSSPRAPLCRVLATVANKFICNAGNNKSKRVATSPLRSLQVGVGRRKGHEHRSTTTPKHTKKKRRKKRQRGVMLGNAQYLPHLPHLPHLPPLPHLPVVSNNSNVQQQ